jgi:hypothetical protein
VRSEPSAKTKNQSLEDYFEPSCLLQPYLVNSKV